MSKSIMQQGRYCYLCAALHDDWTEKPHLERHHTIYGTSGRPFSERYGLTVLLCQEHHTGGYGGDAEAVHMHPNGTGDLLLKRDAQRAFEKKYGHERWMSSVGRDYLQTELTQIDSVTGKNPEKEEKTLNKVALMGRLTKDPDIRYSQGDSAHQPKCIARFTLAVDRRMDAARRQQAQDNNEQTADFISCVSFGKSGEFIEKYCHKGTKLVVTGRIQTGSYTNKEGQKVYTTEVITEETEFAESKSSQHDRSAEPAAGESYGGGFMSIPDGIDEELPFS